MMELYAIIKGVEMLAGDAAMMWGCVAAAVCALICWACICVGGDGA